MKDKSGLTPKQTEEIKQQLLDEKKRLEQELNKIAKVNPHNPNDYQAQFEDYGTDDSDNTAEVIEYGLNLSLERTLEKSLQDVIKALSRLNKNSYGICKYCKKPIGFERLKARPTSSACIECKTKLKSL